MLWVYGNSNTNKKLVLEFYVSTKKISIKSWWSDDWGACNFPNVQIGPKDMLGSGFESSEMGVSSGI